MGKINFFDLKNQYASMKHEINNEINKVLENCNYVLGDQVLQFEKEFSKLHNCK